MIPGDRKCAACGDRARDHAAASDGSLVCQRVARGEGAYLNAGTMHHGVHCSTCGGPCDGHDFYRFVPADQLPEEARAELDRITRLFTTRGT